MIVDWTLVRARLIEIARVFDDAPDVMPGYFVGDVTQERFNEACARGALSRSTAKRKALRGLKALDSGDTDLAELYLREAELYAATSLEIERNQLASRIQARAEKERAGLEKVNREKQAAAADRCDLVKREYRPGLSARQISDNIHRKYLERIPQRTVTRYIKKIGLSKK